MHFAMEITHFISISLVGGCTNWSGHSIYHWRIRLRTGPFWRLDLGNCWLHLSCLTSHLPGAFWRLMHCMAESKLNWTNFVKA